MLSESNKAALTREQWYYDVIPRAHEAETHFILTDNDRRATTAVLPQKRFPTLDLCTRLLKIHLSSSFNSFQS